MDLDNLINVSDDFNDFGNFCPFDNDLSGDFRNSDYLFLDDGNLNSSLNDLLNLFDHNDGMVDNLFNFFYPIPVNYFFFNDFDLSNGWHFNLHLNYLLNGPWHLDNLLNGLDDRNWLLDDNLNDFRKSDDLVNNFSGVSVFDHFNRFFNDPVEWLNHLNNSFNDLFLDNLNFNDFSDDSFNLNDLFPNNLDLSDFRDGMVDDLFNNGWPFNFHYLLSDHLDFHYFGNLHNSFNNLLDYSRHFHYFFSVLRNLNYLLNNVINYLYDFHWHMDDLLNLLDLDDFNWFLDYPFNGHDLRNLDDSFHNLFDNLFNFHNFGNHSENFQDIINIHNSHNLSIDHADHSLINVKNKS